MGNEGEFRPHHIILLDTVMNVEAEIDGHDVLDQDAIDQEVVEHSGNPDMKAVEEELEEEEPDDKEPFCP